MLNLQHLLLLYKQAYYILLLEIVSTLDYKIDMFASLDFAHAYQTCQKCALALSIISRLHTR